MKPESRYRYEQRIKELEEEKARLRLRLEPYEIAAKELYDQVVNNLGSSDIRINCKTVLTHLKRCLR